MMYLLALWGTTVRVRRNCGTGAEWSRLVPAQSRLKFASCLPCGLAACDHSHTFNPRNFPFTSQLVVSPSHRPFTSSSMDVAPNQSLYVNNLNDTLKKTDLRLNLYLLFSTFGTVLDVVALKTSQMRGQAHIVYKDIASASQAMKECDGMEFFGKPMKIHYAKGRSNIISKLEGTYIPTAKSSEDKTASNGATHGSKRARESSEEEED